MTDIISALINAIATIVAAIIGGWVAIKIKGLELRAQERKTGNPPPQDKKQGAHWVWGLIGAVGGIGLMVAFLMATGYIGKVSGEAENAKSVQQATFTPTLKLTEMATPSLIPTDIPTSATPTPDAEFYINRGNSYTDKGEYDLAIADYDKAIELDQNFSLAYRKRGVAYHRKGEYDRAIADYSETILLDPNDAWAYGNRGLAYTDKEEYDLAVADYKKAIELDPDFALAYRNRGLAYEGKGEYDLAIADYERVLELSDDSDLREWVQRKLESLE